MRESNYYTRVSVIVPHVNLCKQYPLSSSGELFVDFNFPWVLTSQAKYRIFQSSPFCFLFCFFREGRRDVLSPPFSGGLMGPNPVTVGEGQGTPWMSRQLIAGPLLMAEAATQVPTAHQEQFWGSVSCSRTLRHVAQFHPRGTRIQTSDLPITSPPALPTELQPSNHLWIVNLPERKPTGTTSIKN